MMPSLTLLNIMSKIENLDTDDFGKFYMYGALLNVINEPLIPNVKPKLLSDHLPKYALPYWPEVALSMGSIHPELEPDVACYSNILKQLPSSSSSELIYILDKMLVHLSKISRNSTKKNSMAYDAMTFGVCQKNIETHLNNAVQLNQARSNLLNRLMSTAFVVLMVMQCCYYAPLLLGIAISIVALILAFGFVQYTKKELNTAQTKYAQSELVLQEEKEKFVLKNMYDKFFISSFVTPIRQTTDQIKRVMPISEDKIHDVPCFQR